jgi:ArsR family transcriptional regulator
MNANLKHARKAEPLTCAEKLKVLADRTRLAVMECLMDGPSHVGKLAEILHVEQSLLSHHLKVLRRAGLVVAHRDGKAVLYRLEPETQVSAPGRAINLGCCQLHFEPGQKRSLLHE